MSETNLVAVETLTPYVNNTKKHPASQIEQLAASIDEFGFVGGVVIRNGTIAKGHGCLEAIKLLLEQGNDIYPPPGRKNGAKPYSRENPVPIIDATGWSDDQFRAYVIADNKLAENAPWDNAMLKVEFSDLKLAGFDLSITGFNPSELNTIFADPTDGKTDEEDTPEPEQRAKAKLGDVWLLGDHRLVCGDSTDIEVVKACLGKAKPHLMVTDPPYGVEYDASWRNKAGSLGKSDRATGKVSNDEIVDWSAAWALFSGDVAYVWHAGNKAHQVADSLIQSGFDIRSQIIWAKNNIVVGRGHYHPKHEPCWYAVRKGSNGHWAGGRKQATVWDIDKPRKSETGHSTQKPVECMRRPIINNSLEGEAVYEPFSGSGTTIIACETTGRTCYAIELNPVYIDVAIKRWQDFTGKDAINKATGKTFGQTRYRKAS